MSGREGLLARIGAGLFARTCDRCSRRGADIRRGKERLCIGCAARTS